MSGGRPGRVEFRLLGEMGVWSADEKIDLGGVKQRGVLAVLLYQPNRVVSRQKIIDLVWSRDEQDRLRSVEKLVPDYLSRIRNQLRHAGITEQQVTLAATRTRQPGYQVTVDIATQDAAVTVDWHWFRLLRDRAKVARDSGDLRDALVQFTAALALWSGPALAELGPTLDPIRRHMTNERLAAAEDLAGIYLDNGDPDRSVTLLEPLAREYPGRERLAALLIRALDQVGRRADTFAVYQRTRSHLAEECGIDPSGLLETVYHDLLHGRRPTRPATGAPVRPADLPYDTRHFIGRDFQVRKLHTLLANRVDARDAVVTCWLDGMAGVGKTTLAVHVAHRLSRYFPDGKLFLDLHGFSNATKPTDAAAALNILLRRIGISGDNIPSDPDGRAVLWRNRLAGKRMLILLDNARDPGQVQPLIPGTPGCSVLVTSRNKRALDDAHQLSLDVLDHAAATTLLRRIIGGSRIVGEPEAVARIVALCGFLPLAIRIIGARLRAHPKLTLGAMVRRLENEHHRLAELVDTTRSVPAAFAQSCQALPDEQRRVLRLAGLAPGSDFDVHAVATLADLSLPRAQRCLDVLLEANLIGQHDDERFHLHGLLRCYAAELARLDEPDMERHAALARLLHYNRTASSSRVLG